MAVIGLYVVARFAWPLARTRAARFAGGLAVMAATLHYPVISRFWGSMASPEVPRVLLLALGTGLMTVLLLAVLLLVRDVIAVLFTMINLKALRRRVLDRRWLPALGAVALLLAAIGVREAVRVPEVRRIEITIPGLPAGFDGYRIAHVTDLHMSRLLQGPWVAKVVERVNALGADAVMLSGDLVDGEVEWRAADYPPLAALSAADGVFASPGNHEYYSGYERWKTVFEGLGIRMLENTHALIERDGDRLVVAGVADRAASQEHPPPDLAAALAGRPEDASVVLLDHRPGNARENSRHGVALQLSGHTHGGHAWGLERLVARFNNGFVSGLYPVDGMQLYVGNGAGLWPGFALRLGPRSEIAEITLRRAGD